MPSISSAAPKILIISPAWVGDMIISQSLYIALKQQYPTAKIDVLAPASTLELAQRMPQISEVIKQPLQHGELNLKRRYRLGEKLRSHHYTHTIVLPNSFKSALIPWWAKIKIRTGWLGEQRRLLLNDIRKLDKIRYATLAQRYVALALPPISPLPTVLEKPQLQVSDTNLKNCLGKIKLTKNKRPIIALCPGAAYGKAKRWSAKYFATVAQHYLQQNWQVWIFGSKNEQILGKEIQNLTANTCTDLTGKTSLLDAVDLLSLASIVVTNDSGLMHIAAAVNVPIVAIYGSSSPHYTPPLTDKAKILQLDYACIPCFKRECLLPEAENLRCLKNLTPQVVIIATEELLT